MATAQPCDPPDELKVLFEAWMQYPVVLDCINFLRPADAKESDKDGVITGAAAASASGLACGAPALETSVT